MPLLTAIHLQCLLDVSKNKVFYSFIASSMGIQLHRIRRKREREMNRTSSKKRNAKESEKKRGAAYCKESRREVTLGSRGLLIPIKRRVRIRLVRSCSCMGELYKIYLYCTKGHIEREETQTSFIEQGWTGRGLLISQKLLFLHATSHF